MGRSDRKPPLRVLIVGNRDNFAIWAEALTEVGMFVDWVKSPGEWAGAVRPGVYDIILLDIDSDFGNASSLADLAIVRHPETMLIPVSAGAHFADGSVFRLLPNVGAQIGPHTCASDVTALVSHVGRTSGDRGRGAASPALA